MLNPHVCGLGAFVLPGATEEAYLQAIEDAVTIAELISATGTKSAELARSAEPELAFLQLRILDTAKAVRDYDTNKRREGTRH